MMANVSAHPESSEIEVLDWGTVDYKLALENQKALLEKRIAGSIPDTLVLCDHPAIITLGRGAQRERPILPPNIPILDVERGGLATYHGPGQLVGYPIFRLAPAKESRFPLGLKDYICRMEKAIIAYLQEIHHLDAQRINGKTGVWIDGKRKIASIGVAVSKWVSYHGFAFNVSTDPNAWRGFNPCGFSAEVMTRLWDESEKKQSLDEVKAALLPYLLKSF